MTSKQPKSRLATFRISEEEYEESKRLTAGWDTAVSPNLRVLPFSPESEIPRNANRKKTKHDWITSSRRPMKCADCCGRSA
jgi:hypothetical protein